MTMTKALLAAAALALSATATPALAHDYDYSYRHARDHAEHRQFHDEAGEAHRRAHEDGFYSEAEHRATKDIDDHSQKRSLDRLSVLLIDNDDIHGRMINLGHG